MEQTIDLKDIIRILKKRYRLIFGIFVVAVLIAVVATLVIAPTFESSATMRIKQKQGLGNSLLSELPGGGNMTKELMSTFAEMVKSRTVVNKVIDGTWQSANDGDKKPSYEAFVASITTTPVRDTQILKVSVKGRSPQEAANRCNVLVETFLNRLATLSQDEQKSVREFIGIRLGDMKKELDKAETALADYKTVHKITSPSDEAKAMMDTLVNLDKVEADNAVKTIAAQAELDTANKQLAAESPGFIASSPLIEQLKGKIADLEVQKMIQLQQYTPKHPQVLATQAAIDEARRNLNAEAERIATANAPSSNPVHTGLLQAKIQAEADSEAGQAQKAAIRNEVDQRMLKLGQLPEKEYKLTRLLRDAKVTEQIYIMMSQRYEEARINEVMTPRDVQVVDEADVPETKISPKNTLNVMIGALLGLFVGVGLALALEFLNRTIRNSDDVEHFLKLPVLGQIPDYSVKQRNFYGRMNKPKRGN